MADAANNPGLVSDCEALLAARDTLAGSATLNWSADTPITEWEGVAVGGVPQRVTGLRLNNRPLSGTIPPELGSLSNLNSLELSWNQLSGEIPSVSIARTYGPVVARVIEPPCGPVDGLLSPLGLRVNHHLSVKQGPVG